MTREDIITAFAMRIDGATYEAIGNHFGVSKQYIHEVLGAPKKGAKIKNCIYPAIADWLDAVRITESECAKACKMSLSSFQLKLSGKRQFKISEIRELLSFSGMTFEEAFGGVDETVEVDKE